MRLLPLAILLAGCPPKGPAGPQSAAAPGCPSASGVYVASYVTSDAGKGRTGWVLPLHAIATDPGAHVPDWVALDAAAAGVSGVPAAPIGTPWLLTAAGAPCMARLGSYYAARVPGPPASITYGVELDGCPAPADPQDAGGIVMMSPLAPTGCQLVPPQPIASRLGETDGQQHWTRPAKQTPIPPELDAIVPAHACVPPACESLWAIGEVTQASKPAVWTVAVNWLAVGDTSKPACEWPSERWSGVFVPGPGGKPMKVEDGQDHSLVLSAALVDQGTVKGLLLEGPGQYATYDLIGGAPKLGHAVTWLLASREAFEMVDHLGPVCEPAEAAPAPLPKGASPVSPY